MPAACSVSLSINWYVSLSACVCLPVCPLCVRVCASAPLALSLPRCHATKPDRDHKVRTSLFPGISVAKPVIGFLHLPPFLDLLREDAVFVTQTVTVRGKACQPENANVETKRHGGNVLYLDPFSSSRNVREDDRFQREKATEVA